jgi:hypothetical protein
MLNYEYIGGKIFFGKTFFGKNIMPTTLFPFTFSLFLRKNIKVLPKKYMPYIGCREAEFVKDCQS